MAIDGNSVVLPVTIPVHGSQAPQPVLIHSQTAGGNVLPQSGNAAIAAASAAARNSARPARNAAPANATPANAAKPAVKSDPGTLVLALNKSLNDSGRPDQFRLASSLGGKVIQQINPATGAVIGEYSAEEFPALAASAEAVGSVVDSIA